MRTRKYRGAKGRLNRANILPFAIVMSRNNRKWHPLPFSLVDLCGDVAAPTIKIKRPQRHSGRLCNREISAKLRTPIVMFDGSFISFNALITLTVNHDWENEYIWIRESLSFYNKSYWDSIMPESCLCKACIVSSKCISAQKIL